MEYLDFLGSSPTFSIFENKRSNTKFGGTLFLIYIIIMFLICLIYILDFILNEKYDVQCSNSFRFDNVFDTNKGKTLNKLPDVSIDYSIQVGNQGSNKWMIKTDEGEYLKHIGLFGFDFTHNLSKIGGKKYSIIYQCENSNCSDLYINKEEYLIIFFKWFYIDSYNTPPIQFIKYGRKGNSARLKENNLLNLKVYWTSIVYKDLKGIIGLFDRFLNMENEYAVGYIDSREYEYLPLEYNDDNKTQPIIAIVNNYVSNKYIEYRRKEIGIMDIIAKIGALFSTFNFIFVSILKFYENNFNNYKIINKIMLPMKIKKDMNITYNEQKENKKENVMIPL